MGKMLPRPEPPAGDDWLTLAQAAAFLGLTPQTTGYHIAQGHLVARKLGPVWMIHTSALREFIRSAWHKAGRPRKQRPDE